MRTAILLGSLYPKEIKGIVSIKRIGDYELEVNTSDPIKDHAEIGIIKIDKEFDITEFKEIIEKLKTYSSGHITNLVKMIKGGSTNRDMRHILATDQLKRTKSIKAVAKALRINDLKNVAYYIDFILVADMLGIKEAIKLIEGAELNQDFSMSRLAVRVELLENKIQMDRIESKRARNERWFSSNKRS